jgi:hypothetical protein
MFRLLLIIVLAAPAAAQTVYKTVEDGVTSFSDSPPAEGAAERLTLHVPPPADDTQLQVRLDAMRESTDRMAADRRAREKHRAELRALNAPPPETIVREQPAMAWTGGFWPTYNRPLRPRPPHRPGRPGVTPLPLPYAGSRSTAQPPPGWSVIKPGNAQLMRPRVYQRRP